MLGLFFQTKSRTIAARRCLYLNHAAFRAAYERSRVLLVAATDRFLGGLLHLDDVAEGAEEAVAPAVEGDLVRLATRLNLAEAGQAVGADPQERDHVVVVGVRPVARVDEVRRLAIRVDRLLDPANRDDHRVGRRVCLGHEAADDGDDDDCESYQQRNAMPLVATTGRR